jgi:hypothetical protein
VDFAAVINGNVVRQSQVVSSLQGGTYIDINSGLVFPKGSNPTADMMNAEVVSAQP